jgi:hypothetical protein
MSADRGADGGMQAGLLLIAAAELAWLAFLAWMAWRS